MQQLLQQIDDHDIVVRHCQSVNSIIVHYDRKHGSVTKIATIGTKCGIPYHFLAGIGGGSVVVLL